MRGCVAILGLVMFITGFFMFFGIMRENPTMATYALVVVLIVVVWGWARRSDE